MNLKMEIIIQIIFYLTIILIINNFMWNINYNILLFIYLYKQKIDTN